MTKRLTFAEQIKAHAEQRINSKTRWTEGYLAMTTGHRADSGTLNVARNLFEEVETDIVYTLLAPTRAGIAVPFVATGNAAAETESFVTLDANGEAKTIANARANDVPTIGTQINKKAVPVLDAAISYSYRMDNAAATLLSGVDEAAEGARAAAKSIKAWHDRLVLRGEPGTVTGFANSVDIDIITRLSSNVWSNSSVTGDDIYADLCALYNAIDTDVNSDEAYLPDTLALSQAQFTAANQKMVGADKHKTALEKFRDVYPQFAAPNAVFQWVGLDTMGVSGNNHRAVMYKRSKDVVQYRPAVYYEEMAPQPHAFALTVFTRGRGAGVQWKRPQAAKYMDNI